MAARDLDDDESEDSANSREEQLLYALARAPSVEAQGLVARALPEFADTVDMPTPLSASGEVAPPRVGDLIDGRYRIEGVIGSGGMGVVFAALHTSTGRRVALKWMLAHGLYRTAAERAAATARFVREAQATGRIKHPNVVDVYDAGVDPQAPYLVMERLEGEPLRALVDRGPIAWEEALAIVLPVMEGVAAAHRQGVVHRDLKPDNIFLARDAQGSLRPKVLDFGISRLRASEAGEASLTRTGAMIGTPAYMPLEQLRGSSEVDERTDIYALGVVLYELLTGTRPYVARNAADFAAVLASEPPTPLSSHRPELAGSRERALMQALARDPRERYPSVAAFSAALSTPASAVRPHGRRLALGLALLGAGVVSLALWAREPTTYEAVPAAPRLAQPRSTPAPAAAPASAASPAPEPASAPAPSRGELTPPSPAPHSPHALAKRRARPSTQEVVPAAPSKLVPMQADDFARPADVPTARRAGPGPSPHSKPSLDLDREQF